MFSLKVLRLKSFCNKSLTNAIKLNQINAKYLFNSSRKVEQIANAVNQNSSAKAEPSSATDSKQISLLDRRVRNEMLHNLFVLAQSVSKGQRSVHQLVSEDEFKWICDTIDGNLKHLQGYQLTHCLKSFVLMGIDPESRIIQSIENELLWKSKKFHLKPLLHCLAFHVRHQKTELQKKVVNELIINLVFKLDEAADLEDLTQVLSLSPYLSPEILTKVEMMAIDMIGSDADLDFDSLSYILVLLSQMTRRTKPLIQAVVNRFTYCSLPSEAYNESKLINMISALNVLNYPDINFLAKASKILCNKNFLNAVNPSNRRDLLVAFSQLNWSDSQILDQFVEKIIDTNNNFTAKDFLILVSSFARLNFRSLYLKEILSNYVLPRVRQEDLDCESWLLYVWSLALLDCLPLKIAQSVLNQEFCDQLMSNSESQSEELPQFKQNLFKLKLLNIKAVVELELDTTIDFKPTSDASQETAKKEVSVEKLKNSVVKCLNSFVPNLSTNVLTPYGFAIDAEFILDNNFESLPVKDYGFETINEQNQLPALPDGYRRYALMCFGFKDTLLDGSGFIGVRQLSIRLLKKLGYNVIPITDTECPTYLNDEQKWDRLKTLIDSQTHSE